MWVINDSFFTCARCYRLKSFVNQVEHPLDPPLFSQEIGYAHDVLAERVFALRFSLLQIGYPQLSAQQVLYLCGRVERVYLIVDRVGLQLV